MNDKETVSEIIEPVSRQGVSQKNGKPWSMAKIVTNTGKSATCFNPVVVGDEVEITYNDQYKSWNAKVISTKQRNYQEPSNSDDLSKMLNMIYEQTQAIMRGINDLKGIEDEPAPRPLSGYEKAKAVAQNLAEPKSSPLPEEPGDLDAFMEDIEGLPY